MKFVLVKKRLAAVALGFAMILGGIAEGVYAAEAADTADVADVVQTTSQGEIKMDGLLDEAYSYSDIDDVSDAKERVDVLEGTAGKESTAVKERVDVLEGTDTQESIEVLEGTDTQESIEVLEGTDVQENVPDELVAGSELSIAWDWDSSLYDNGMVQDAAAVYGDIATDPNSGAAYKTLTEEEMPKLQTKDYAVAIGAKKQIEAPDLLYTVDPGITGYVPANVVTIPATLQCSISWNQSIPSNQIATVSEGGLLSGISKGKIKVSLQYSYIYNNVVLGSKTEEVTVYVTDPYTPVTDMNINLFNVARNSAKEYTVAENYTFTGLESCSVITAYVEPNVAGSIRTKQGLSNNHKNILYLFPTAPGDYVMTINVDGREFKCNLNILNVYFNRSSRTIGDKSSKKWVMGRSTLCLKTGEEIALKVKGFPIMENIVWESSNPEVATVDENGLVESVGLGDATITATAHNFPITYQVTVAHPTALKALQYAYKHWQSTYSQAHRMSAGKYDCSSFVWRSYKAAGYYVGSKYVAATAADQLRWAMMNNYVIYSGRSTIDTSMLQAGDLIYWAYTKPNHRYKNIGHVDFYIGNNTRLTVPAERYFANGKVDNGGNYCYIVRLFGTKGSNLVAKKATGQVIGDEGLVGSSLDQVGKKGVNLMWKKNWGASGYRVYRATSKNGKYKKLKTLYKVNVYNDKTAKKGKTYYYRIRPFYKGYGKTYFGKYSLATKIRA